MTATNNPRISVLIVSWNTIDLLRACLLSIRDLIEKSTVEVIVVDNGSHDGSPAMVSKEFPDVILIENKDNLGFARANNQAYVVSKGEYCLLLNSDTEASEAAVMRCVDCLDANDDVAVIGCRLEYPSRAFQSSCFRFPSIRGITLSCLGFSQLNSASPVFNYERYGHEEWNEAREVDCVMGSFMLLRRAALNNDMIFDEGYFMYAEETELCWLLKRDKWKVLYLPEVSIIHHWGGSSGRTPTVAAWAYEGVRRGTLRFLYRNRGVLLAGIANGIYLLTLLPRALYWILADSLKSARSRKVVWEKALKLRVVPFHMKAVLIPKTMIDPWEAPK